MQLYLDSADLEEIRSAAENFPILGVTTNPTILARSGAQNPAGRLTEIREIIGDRLLFVQLTASGLDESLEEAEAVSRHLSGPLCFKVPVGSANVAVISALCERGMDVCATAVYTVPQAVICAEAGARFVAPYVSHLDALPTDGPSLCGDMQKTLAAYGYGTAVLGASFRVLSQIDALMRAGVAAATVTYPMLEELASSRGSEQEIASFHKNWRTVYGMRTLGDFFGE